MISADPTSAPVVTPPPRANRLMLGSHAAAVLIGTLGCIATIAGAGRGSPLVPAVVAGTSAGLLLCMVGSLRTQARQQDRARATVGWGPGREVVLLPVLTARSYPLWFAVRPVEGGAPLGRIALPTTGTGFDPWATYVAWGRLVPDQPIALTATDGRQMVLPITPLVRLDRRFRPSEDMTHVVGRILGWPPADRAQGSRLADLDAALVEWRSRLRIIGPATIVIPPGLAYTVLMHLDIAPSARKLGFAVVALLASLAAHRVCQAPLRAVVAEAAAARSVPAAKAARAALQARYGAHWEQAPHAPAGAADGSGWMPPPLPLPPR